MPPESAPHTREAKRAGCNRNFARMGPSPGLLADDRLRLNLARCEDGIGPERVATLIDTRERGLDFMLDRWDNFFVMVGSGSAALAGLIFVAMSIKPEGIIRNTTHKNRAINMLSGFTAVFMACSFALIGNQPPRALGIEWLVLWLIATAIFIRGYAIAIKAGVSFIGLNVPRLGGGTLCYLAEVIAAICLILGYERCV